MPRITSFFENSRFPHHEKEVPQDFDDEKTVVSSIPDRSGSRPGGGVGENVDPKGFPRVALQAETATERKEREPVRFTVGKAEFLGHKTPEEKFYTEDVGFVSADSGLLVVSDGAGGYANSKEISKAILNTVLLFQGKGALGEPHGKSAQAQDADLEILFTLAADNAERVSKTLRRPSNVPMATLLMARVYETPEGTKEACLKSVGDSLAYVWRAGEQRLEEVDIPPDDVLEKDGVRENLFSSEEAKWIRDATGIESFVQDLARAGYLSQRDVVTIRMSTDSFSALRDIAGDSETQILKDLVFYFTGYWSHNVRSRFAFGREVTQMVGRNSTRDTVKIGSGEDARELPPLVIHSAVIPFGPEDELYVCSDGVESLSSKQIAAILAQSGTPQEKAQRLVDTAAAVTGFRRKPDDIMVVALKREPSTIKPSLRATSQPARVPSDYSEQTVVARDLENRWRQALRELGVSSVADLDVPAFAVGDFSLLESVSGDSRPLLEQLKELWQALQDLRNPFDNRFDAARKRIQTAGGVQTAKGEILRLARSIAFIERKGNESLADDVKSILKKKQDEFDAARAPSK
ncbi:hypothetical protein HY734_02745 [Candidatus Uhrbacteria bacterium]|nr:hypothetical protein [Candidatus Uhrbacteria bacterium]